MGTGHAFVDTDYCEVADAKISVLDPGFSHCDVVYDVTSTWKHNFFRLDEHIARFLRSCAGIHLKCPYSADEIRRILATCVDTGGVGEASYVSMALTRGDYTEEGRKLRDLTMTRPVFIAYAIPYVWIGRPEDQKRGLKLITAKTPRISDASVNMRYKNYHWGDLTQARFEARAAGVDNAVLCTADGRLAEGPGFNVFVVKDGRLYTPEHNVLEGVTRAAVLDLAAELGIPAETGDYPGSLLHEADEVFITSTAGGVMPVAKVDDHIMSNGAPGEMSVRLHDEYWKRRDVGWCGTPVASLV